MAMERKRNHPRRPTNRCREPEAVPSCRSSAITTTTAMEPSSSFQLRSDQNTNKRSSTRTSLSRGCWKSKSAATALAGFVAALGLVRNYQQLGCLMQQTKELQHSLDDSHGGGGGGSSSSSSDGVRRGTELESPAATRRQQQHRPQQRKNGHRGDPVGTVNGFDLYLVDEPPRTRVRCVGDSYHPRSTWNFRSCEYQLLCYDLALLDEFVVYDEKGHLDSKLPRGWFSGTLRNKDDQATDIEVNTGLAPRRGIRPRGFNQSFAPRVVSTEPPPPSYLLLDAVMIPYIRHELGYHNPGHLFWQDLIPLYRLIDLFGREGEELFLAPLRRNHREGNVDLMNKLGAKLMGMPSFAKYDPYWNGANLTLNITTTGGASSGRRPGTVICARHALAGTGVFGTHEQHTQNGTMHQPKATPNVFEPIKGVMWPRLHGDGGFFYRMRGFMMNNLGIEDGGGRGGTFDTEPSSLVLFSVSSSSSKKRKNIDFSRQIAFMRDAYSDESDHVEIVGSKLSNSTIEDQVRLISRARVMVSVTGGGTATSIFLPRAAHLILFYHQWFLDWDYFNNMGHIIVHWVPIEILDDPRHLPNLKLLFDECLDRLSGADRFKIL